jgi:prepilin-type N-terminal cleavage/methylation domain-containing protein
MQRQRGATSLRNVADEVQTISPPADKNGGSGDLAVVRDCRAGLQFIDRCQAAFRRASPRRLRMKKRPGFTMTELLVVISIMIVLATLLIPNLVHIRRVAKRTSCAVKLRDLGGAMILYTGDNNGMFPPHALDQSPDPARWWGHDREMREDDRDAFGELYFYLNDPEAYQCPTLNTSEVANGQTLSWGLTARNVGYGYNAFFLGRYDGRPIDQLTTAPPVEGGIQTEWAFNIAAVLDGSRTIMMADSTISDGSHPDSAIMWWPTTTKDNNHGAYLRHLDEANVVTVDQGVRSLSEDEMFTSGGQAKLSLWDPRGDQRPSP